MLQAMNTGHDGSLSTIHANTPRDALARIETMVLMAGYDLPVKAIRQQVASALDLIVHLERLQDGSRRVTAITEVQRMESDVDHAPGPLQVQGRRRRRPTARWSGGLRADRPAPDASSTSSSAAASTLPPGLFAQRRGSGVHSSCGRPRRETASRSSGVAVARRAARGCAGAAQAAERAARARPASAHFPERAYVLTLPSARRSTTADVTRHRERRAGRRASPSRRRDAPGTSTFGVVLAIDASGSMRGADRRRDGRPRARSQRHAQPSQRSASSSSAARRDVAAAAHDATRRHRRGARRRRPQLAGGTHIYDAARAALELISDAGIALRLGRRCSPTAPTRQQPRRGRRSSTATASGARRALFAVGLRSRLRRGTLNARGRSAAARTPRPTRRRSRRRSTTRSAAARATSTWSSTARRRRPAQRVVVEVGGRRRRRDRDRAVYTAPTLRRPRGPCRSDRAHRCLDAGWFAARAGAGSARRSSACSRSWLVRPRAAQRPRADRRRSSTARRDEPGQEQTRPRRGGASTARRERSLDAAALVGRVRGAGASSPRIDLSAGARRRVDRRRHARARW